MENIQTKLLYLGTFTAFSLLLYALWAQHIGGYEPCVRCIYQRMAILTIAFGGVISLLHFLLRPIGLIIVLIAAVMGLIEAYTHVGVMAGTVEDFCPFRPDFGMLGRLDETLPWFFEALGECADESWKMLGFNMPQWVLFICLNFALFSFLMLCYWGVELSKKLKNTL